MSNIQEIEVSMNELMDCIKKANMVASLHHNHEFKEIVVDGFFTDYPARLVRSLADPQIANNEAKRQQVLRTLEGISAFHDYLNAVHQKGVMATDSLENHKAELAYEREQAANSN